MSQGELGNIKRFIENPIKSIELNVNINQSISDIFRAHHLVIDLDNKHLGFKNNFIKLYEEKLT
jgi:hypothetical protein